MKVLVNIQVSIHGSYRGETETNEKKTAQFLTHFDHFVLNGLSRRLQYGKMALNNSTYYVVNSTVYHFRSGSSLTLTSVHTVAASNSSRFLGLTNEIASFHTSKAYPKKPQDSVFGESLVVSVRQLTYVWSFRAVDGKILPKNLPVPSYSCSIARQGSIDLVADCILQSIWGWWPSLCISFQQSSQRITSIETMTSPAIR